MNSPHPNFGSKDDIFLLESQHWNGGLPTHSMLSPHACHRNNDSCCNIHHNCSLHNSDNHLHLDFLTCIYCKVFYSWCPLPPSISSFHTLFLGKQPKQREGEHWAGSGTSSSKRYVCFDRWVILPNLTYFWEVQGHFMVFCSKNFRIFMAPANMDFQTTLWVWCKVTLITFELFSSITVGRWSRGGSSVLLH